MAKINKALDLNKLFQEQAKGKLLKKKLIFPMFAGVKYDGIYSVILKEGEELTYISSGGHIYVNKEATIFNLPNVPSGAYIAERIGTDGKLGDRTKCALRGPRHVPQIAYNHGYLVHDMVSLDDYERGRTNRPYRLRREDVRDLFGDYWAADLVVHSQEEIDSLLAMEVKKGWEGLMLKSPFWKWEHTRTRSMTLVKYKKRPTVDLLVIGWEESNDTKYEGLIGALIVKDSVGREVSVGSGMSDEDRNRDPDFFIGSVVEVFYEQIIATYIQPTFGSEYEGVLVREDKTAEDID